jgi:formylglycine-generating enzyme required for sulfatase activity
MGQGGNVWEWMETAYDGTNNTVGELRELRGGSLYYNSVYLDASNRGENWPEAEDSLYMLGFRVASVPEPSALSLLAVGLSGLAMMRCRRS